MTSLHAYFHYRDQAAFQRQLAGASPADVNVRDWLGRTVLHLACAASDPAATEYVRLLLAHSGINVNIPDAESHWTALHRALYHGNLAAAILLLQRDDIETNLTDLEGYRAFDLYNTTVEDTMPKKLVAYSGLEVFTWGANRNASLGHGDGDDRAHPEQIILKRIEGASRDSTANGTVGFRLQPSLVRDVQMSRLHTVVVTDEPRGNVRACGYAGTGRLGPGGGQHAQPYLSPVTQFPSEVKVTAVALGQDHTLALTSDGTVLSWGDGRFSQLGYDLPAPHIQSTPRIIGGPLRREHVRGVAACKSASACWTDSALFTWGKNSGQLGYDKIATPVQLVPRISTKVTKPVVSVALNDVAMACLLVSHEVLLVSNDSQSRVSFPSPSRLPSDFHAYRPPQAAQTITTAKVLCSESVFATVSSTGEIFTFNAPVPPTPGERPILVPQRVWALRKQWSAVHDAAIGRDGSLIICTESGHVFVRSRSSSVKIPRFVRVLGLQRAIAVRANETGALAALRQPYRPTPIIPVGNSLAEDVARLRPYLSFSRVEREGVRIEPGCEVLPVRVEEVPARWTIGEEDEEGDAAPEAAAIVRDVQEVLRLWDLLNQDKRARRRPHATAQGIFASSSKLIRGADLVLRVQGAVEFPVHAVILSARCAALARVLGGFGSFHDRESGISFKHIPAPHPKKNGPPCAFNEAPRLAVSGVHAFSVLVLVHYLYTDTLLAISDPRVVRSTSAAFSGGRLQPTQAVRELQTLASVLHLHVLEEPLRVSVRREPLLTLNAHLGAVFDAPASGSASPPDVVLKLADRDVRCHSAILRTRSPFFEAFFEDEAWTADRWEDDGALYVNLQHLGWRTMQYVLRFICCGEEGDMFERLESVDSGDQLLDTLFDIMYAANELLLDRLLLICASIIVDHVTIHNISAVYTEAAALHCEALMDSLHQYIAVNMETLLEAHLLGHLPPRLIRQLVSAVFQHQALKSPFSRLQLPVDLVAAVSRNRDWLAVQDIPSPIVRSQPRAFSKQSPKRHRKSSFPTSPGNKPTLPRTPLLSNTSEDLFAMDETLVPPFVLDAAASVDDHGQPSKLGPWKGKSTPRVDMKAILAEAEEMQSAGRTQRLASGPSTSMSVNRQRSGDRIRVSFSLSAASDTPPSGSPAAPRTAPSPAWRTSAPPAEPPGSSPGRASISRKPSFTAQSTSRTPPTSTHMPEKTQTSQHAAASHLGLGPVISPSKVKMGQTATRHASTGKAWILPPVEPISQPSPGSPVSFAEIQQLQSQPDKAAKDKRSLRDIQAEEAEIQAEVDFMKWWTAEEERIRLETEASIASAASQPKKGPGHAKKSKRVTVSGSDSVGGGGPNVPHSREQKRQVVQRGTSSS
ncbi:hypothetical protein BC834DRAFT_892147 [Gloeopeniophorella convolvens]|nr:hypothetical protein BC834DRAFT_892147 [Gloeopeniophorella convolvens]